MSRLRFPLFAGLVILFSPSLAAAALSPEEIAVVAIRDSNESKAVASYYTKVRQIPRENVLLLGIPAGEDLSREAWDKQVRPAVRSWLGQNDRLKKIRCFVTVWDVPLRITTEGGGGDADQLVRYFQRERADRVERIAEFAEALYKIAGKSPPKTLSAEATLDEVKQHLDESFRDAQNALNAVEDEAAKATGTQQLQSIYFQSVGLNMMAQSLARQLQAGASAADPRTRSEFDTARGRTIGLREGRAAMEGLPFSLEREPQLLAVIQLSDGIYGTIAWIDEQLDTIRKNETYASFDSELSIVAWSDYQLVRWQPNLLHYRFDGSLLREFKPTMMVSRLEAPTLALTRKIIDDALFAEENGLISQPGEAGGATTVGKVYLDARGLAELTDTVQPGSYEDYDQAVLKAADLLQNHTDLEVVLDTRQDLFPEQPDEANQLQAALYCGWYSLAKYVDAFRWNRGAVAYHMASAEARTLRKPDSQVWGKRLLEDGAAATIGPVEEPYISAFPRPNEFFALLLSGDYTLAESYYRCKPFNSWTMVLIGDPLYNPFAKNPPLRRENLDPLYQRIINGRTSLVDEVTPVATSSGGSAETP